MYCADGAYTHGIYFPIQKIALEVKSLKEKVAQCDPLFTPHVSETLSSHGAMNIFEGDRKSSDANAIIRAGVCPKHFCIYRKQPCSSSEPNEKRGPTLSPWATTPGAAGGGKTYAQKLPEPAPPGQLCTPGPGARLGHLWKRTFGDVVIDLIGRCGMDYTPENPFLQVERILKRIETKLIFVELHAEATSEKLAMGHHAGRACHRRLGTHTHVPTADAQLLPGGTGYLTDLGMTLPAHSILGVKPAQSIAKFRGDLA